MRPPAYEDVWREASPHVLAALAPQVRRLRRRARTPSRRRSWPRRGSGRTRASPTTRARWLIRVGSRRLIDARRADRARARARGRGGRRASSPGRTGEHDDSLALLLLCCHPALSRPSQVALTLRAVGGLGTDRIARAFLVPESTMAQRISRAQGPAARGRRAVRRAAAGRAARARRGGGARAVPGLHRGAHRDRGCRPHRRLAGRGGDPAHPAAARPAAGRSRGGRAARADAAHRRPAAGPPRRGGGAGPARRAGPLPLGPRPIAEGVALVEGALPHGPVGPYQLQAAIAAVHAEAAAPRPTPTGPRSRCSTACSPT